MPARDVEEVLLVGVDCVMMLLGQPKSESGRSPSPKGPWSVLPRKHEPLFALQNAPGRAALRGEAVSVYEIIVIIFLAMTFVVALIKLMIYITDIFSKRK